jgi:hypothetical protein
VGGIEGALEADGLTPSGFGTGGTVLQRLYCVLAE